MRTDHCRRVILWSTGAPRRAEIPYESYDCHGTIRTVKATHILSDLELALLGFIREEPRSGYVLRKAIADFPQISDSPGAIYPALRRMRAAGLIECSGGATGRKTEVFRATAAGRRALRSTLEAAPFDRESAMRQTLRLTFIDLELEQSAVAQFLQACARVAEEKAEKLRTRHAVLDRSSAALAIEQEIETETARARWAERAAKRLKR